MRKSSLKVVLFLALGIGSLWAQFKSTSILIDDRMLRDSDRQVLFSLKSDIDRFFSQTTWDENYNDLQLSPQIQLIFESTSSKGSVLIYQCQALFSVGSEQRYFDKSVQFYYQEGSGLYYDPVIFDPLSSFLSYYAFIMLAGEIDTYEPLGGTTAYEQARSIGLRGANSDLTKGWDKRVDLINELSSNFGFRRAKFAFYYGRDLFLEGKPVEALEQFDTFIKGLKESYNRDPRDQNLLLFLRAHASTATGMFVTLNQKKYLEHLLHYDPDNEEIYTRGLDQISP